MTFPMRMATRDDETAVVALWNACELTAPLNDPRADFRYALAGPSSAVLVADDLHGPIVGSVMVEYDGHRGWLYYVASAPDRRGQGIGKAVVEAAERWLRDRQVPKAHRMVRPTNRSVIGFYQRLGYDDMPRVLMSKRLDS